MGKKAPNKYVTNGLRPFDKQIIKGLGRCGTFTRKQIEKEWGGEGGITEHRLKQLKNSKYIKFRRGKYTLGHKGEEYCRSIGMRLYKKSGFIHDNQLANVYLDYSREEREGWMTESELREYASQQPGYDDFKSRMEEMHSQGKVQATPDAAIKTKDGRLIAVEIVTKFYSAEEIIQKDEFSTEFLDDINYYEV